MQINPENSNFYMMIENNNNHTECEISLFNSKNFNENDLERLARSIFSYYEY